MADLITLQTAEIPLRIESADTEETLIPYRYLAHGDSGLLAAGIIIVNTGIAIAGAQRVAQAMADNLAAANDGVIGVRFTYGDKHITHAVSPQTDSAVNGVYRPQQSPPAMPAARPHLTLIGGSQ